MHGRNLGELKGEKAGKLNKKRRIFFPGLLCCNFSAGCGACHSLKLHPSVAALNCQWLAAGLGWFRFSAFAERTATFAAGACPWTTTPLNLHSPHQRLHGLGPLELVSSVWLFAKVSPGFLAGPVLFSAHKSWDQSSPSLRQSDHILSPLFKFRNQTQLARWCLERRWAYSPLTPPPTGRPRQQVYFPCLPA